MSIYKRKGSNLWWLTITNPRTGKRIRKSCKTTDRSLAQQVCRALEAALLLGLTHPLAEKGKDKRTWDEAAERWLRETNHKKDHGDDKAKIAWLKPHLGGLLLKDIDAVKIKAVLNLKFETAAPATSNKYLSLIRAILNRAFREWGWLDKVPHVRPFAVSSKRIRFLTKPEAQKLLEQLPQHLADMMTFTLCTGLRASNVSRLKWEQVDLEKAHLWIYCDEAKAGRDIGVPLNATAVEVLKRQLGKNPLFVFTYKGHPVTRPYNHAWRKALKRAGISDFRWHDLRHTWASWHAQAGTPLHVLQELGGWHSFQMVQRYAHLSAEHLASYTINTHYAVLD